MAQIEKSERLELKAESDVVLVRQAVRKWAADLRFSIVDQTKLVTAASELARNTVVYGGGGAVMIESIVDGVRKGLRVIFEDHGPGIEDIALALRDGFTTGGGLGLGLGGAKRLVNDFHIDSRPGVGTRIEIARWR